MNHISRMLKAERYPHTKWLLPSRVVAAGFHDTVLLSSLPIYMAICEWYTLINGTF